MRHRRPGGQARDAPAGDGGNRGRQHRIPGLPAAAKREGRHARAFRGELQTAGGGGIQPPHLADDTGEAAMAQSLLHGEEHGAPGIDEQHAVGGETHLGQSGCEEIGAFRRPEHRAVEAREDAGDHKPGRRRVFKRGAGIREFVQPAEAQAAPRQMMVDGVDPEGQRWAEGQRGASGFCGPSPLQRGKCLA
jgi:hypothetical protein